MTLKQEAGSKRTLGRLRIAAIGVPAGRREPPAEIAAILKVAPAKRGDNDRQRLATYYRGVDPERVKLQRAVDAHEKKAPTPPPTHAQTLAEHTPRRSTRVLVRGDFLRPSAEVSADTPHVLPPFKARDAVPDRIDLARWLTSPVNPLTPRVTANRIWQHLFGQGLVATPEDFGTRGEKPSHPQLLEWLARQLVSRGWGVKSMIRYIVSSSTYRQSSDVREDLTQIDSANKLLARQNRYRLDAEVLRDVYLASSGLLARRIGGPSVRPPLPKGVRELGYANSVKWPESEGADKYRRGLYIFFQRTVPYPMLTTFDAPDSNVTCVRRRSSNTPLQALTLLNDPVFFECAQALGRRVLEEAGAAAADRLDAGIDRVFLLTVGRRPAAEERQQIRKLYDDLLALYREHPEDAAKMVGGTKNVDVAELAVWTTVARMVLNLDEVVTRG